MSDNTLKIWAGNAANGVPCSAYLTGLTSKSGNAKTGPLIMQISMMADRVPTVRYDDVKVSPDGEPVLDDAGRPIWFNLDCHEAVCKGCRFRPDLAHYCPYCGKKNEPGPATCDFCGKTLGVCYVNRAKGQGAAYLYNICKPVTPWPEVEAAMKRAVDRMGMKLFRFGAFGNCTMLGEEFIERCGGTALSLGMKVVGYVADWMFYPKDHIASKYCLASCGLDPEDKKRELAHSLGWRTFRAKLENEKKRKGESICTHEQKGIQCADCAKCGGRSGDIVVTLHR